MSNAELWNVLNFVKERGAVHEMGLCQNFMKNESNDERLRVLNNVRELAYKGLLQYGYNASGETVIKYTRLDYQ